VFERLKKKYHFYSQYHRNFGNKLIHFICIPSICFSLFVLLNYIPFEFDFTKYIPNSNNTYLEKITIPKCTFILRPSFILYLLYFIYYIYLSPCIGLITNVLYFGLLLGADFFYCEVSNAFIYALGIQAGSWLLQLIGHSQCEGNKPAFTKGLLDSIMVAPLFVVLECLKVFTCCIPSFKNLKLLDDVGDNECEDGHLYYSAQNENQNQWGENLIY
jgi:uncharacterized membrane protein YGL010W